MDTSPVLQIFTLRKALRAFLSGCLPSLQNNKCLREYGSALLIFLSPSHIQERNRPILASPVCVDKSITWGSILVFQDGLKLCGNSFVNTQGETLSNNQIAFTIQPSQLSLRVVVKTDPLKSSEKWYKEDVNHWVGEMHYIFLHLKAENRSKSGQYLDALL